MVLNLTWLVMAKDLLDNLDFSGLHCLNENPAHAWANALKQGYMEDDGAAHDAACRTSC